MKNHRLGPRSLKNLRGVHPDLVKVVKRALRISPCDFTIIEGCRTLERQKRLKASGASKTLRSRHIPCKVVTIFTTGNPVNFFGHAVDIVPWINGTVDWNDPSQFCQVGHAMRVAAMDLGIPLTWGAGKMYGGHWSNSFNDMPHFQLTWEAYPK